MTEEQEEKRYLANLKRMIRTANKAAETKDYIHTEIELGAIRRVMDASTADSIPLGADRIIIAYYERMTGREAYL